MVAWVVRECLGETCCYATLRGYRIGGSAYTLVSRDRPFSPMEYLGKTLSSRTCHEKTIEHRVGAFLSRGGAWVARRCLGQA